MKDEFLIMRSGKQYVLFAGLLDEGHSRGLKGIDTDLVQVPAPENGNVAVVKATVEMEDGRTFSGIGDASPDNVGRGIVPHIIRMAETRAKARALRDAVNVGSTSLEELSDGDAAEPAATAGQTGSGTSSRTSANPGWTRGRSGGRSSGSAERPQVSVVPDAPAQEETRDGEKGSGAAAAEETPDGTRASSRSSGGSTGGKRVNRKANKSQKDSIRKLAVEWRGEGGIERLEGRIGKSIDDLTASEAEDWIERLTPKEDGSEGARREA